ncbi:ABC transporter permease subunit [Nakamurella sp. YIM 132087]|uniref:ABC transporter permease subunit n=1 Tax=Nakamurella alba TaxID=2665158 RepID=A0A7K1FEE9_9ACTN|nr:ABC transporter permease [Nakamurella alba]MTD12450.1 ABC transporter permease subunit [Nakamurella alba]
MTDQLERAAATAGTTPVAAGRRGIFPWGRILRRLGTGILVLWAAVTAAFFVLRAIPGSIADILAGDQNYPGLKEAINAEWGLADPVWLQYLQYLGRLVTGDLGTSYVQRRPVGDIIAGEVWSTVELALAALLLGVVLAVALSVFSLRRGRVARALISTVELVFTSVPVFWVGILLLTAFSFTLQWFPVSGANGWNSLVLPTITLALPTAGVLGQVLRESMERTLGEPFVLSVRARGVAPGVVLVRHALKHALLPAMTLAGSIVGGLLGGAVITETVFGRPGLGSITLRAVTNKDVPVVLAVVLFAALIYVVVSTLLDILYTVVDPRLRGTR